MWQPAIFGTAELLEATDRAALAAITFLEACFEKLTRLFDDIYLTANVGR